MKTDNHILLNIMIVSIAGVLHLNANGVALAKRYYPTQELSCIIRNTTSIAVGDIDNDGDIDMVAGNDGSENTLYKNNGKGDLSDTSGLPYDNYKTRGVQLVDLDNDGDLDLISADGNSSGDASSHYYFNDGSGTFTSAKSFESLSGSAYAKSIVAGDIDGDNDLDVVIAYYGKNRVCKQGTTPSTWSCSDISSDSDNSNEIVLVDIDGDSDLDVIVGNSGTYNKYYLNNGVGSFTSATNFGSSGDSTFSIAVGDVDGDNDSDIVVANYNQIAQIYYNDGSGALSASNIGTFSHIAYGVTLGDIDKDGDLDIIFANSNHANILYINDGSGVFSDSMAFKLDDNTDSYEVKIADVDRDNDFDILTADFGATNTLIKSRQTQSALPAIISYLLNDSPSATPTLPTAPTSITVLPVNQSSDKMQITWHDNSNNEDGFVIYRSSSSDVTSKIQVGVTGANISTFSDSGLNSCQQYYYWVSAKNSVGEKLSSSAYATTPPLAPANFKAYKGPGVFSIHLDWDAQSCATGYHAYVLFNYGENYVRQTTLPVTDTQLNITDVPEDTTYFLRVSSVDANGNEGDLSCRVVATAPQAGATSQNDSCMAAVAWAEDSDPKTWWGSYNNYTDKVYIGWDSVALTWNSNAVAQSYAQEYYIQISMDNVNWYNLNSTGSVFSHPNDSTPMVVEVPVSNDNSLYYFKVYTRYWYDINHDGTDDYVQSDTPITITTRTAATNQTTTILPAPWVITSKYYANKIMVGWGSIEGATGYRLYRSTNRDSAYALKYSGTSTSIYDNSVNPYTDYWYKVCAVNSSSVCGLMSDPVYGNATDLNWAN